MRVRPVLAALALVALAACSAGVADVDAGPSRSATSAPTGRVPGLPAAEPLGDGIDPLFPGLGSPGIDVRHYDVALTTVPGGPDVAGTVGIDLVLTADTATVDLDAVGLAVSEVTVDGTPAEFVLTPSSLRIQLPGPGRAGDEVRLGISYRATPAASRASGLPAGWFATSTGSYVLNEPDGARTWLPSNDHPSDKATWHFQIDVPSGVEAVANGRLASHTTTPAGERWVWEQDQPMATYLVQLITGQLEVVDGTSSRGLPLTSVVPAGSVERMRPYLDGIDEQLAFLTDRFGPYPLDRYGIAVADTEPGVAMETQGRSQFSSTDLTGSLGYVEQLVLSHELAHQWFGNAVTPARWSDIWLNESFATYAQWLWLDHVGMASLEDQAAAALATRQRPTFATVDPPADQLFANEVYDGGATVLQALRCELGDEAFFTTLRSWVAENAGASRTTDDFIGHVEAEHPGVVPSSFWDDWLRARQLPAHYPCS